MSILTRAAVLEAARSCLETPFQHQGRLNGLALDCAGLIVVVSQMLDIPVGDVQGYGTDPSNGLLEDALDRQESVFRVMDGTLYEADILIMRWARDPRHLAFYAGATVIHALLEVGKVCEHDFTEEWKRRVVRTYRYKALA